MRPALRPRVGAHSCADLRAARFLRSRPNDDCLSPRCTQSTAVCEVKCSAAAMSYGAGVHW